MEHVKTFLDTSTIHGLSWISGTKSWLRLFWILVVIGGFSGAGYLIYTSFNNWEQSPISTTIETLPISRIIFPNITVCPPKQLFLNLNYDIQKSETVNLDDDSRKELIDFATDVCQDEFYNEILSNLSKVEDPDRYYNWYHGFTDIIYPYHDQRFNQLWYSIVTYAKSGNISTKYFGKKFDASKVDDYIYIGIQVYAQQPASNDINTTLILNVNKKTMTGANDHDKMTCCVTGCDTCYINSYLKQWSKNITYPFKVSYFFSHERGVTQEFIRNMELDTVPGFQLTWKYDKQVEALAPNILMEKTKQFIR